MKKLLTERTASYCIVLALTLIVLFHLLILLGVVPFQLVWGGRLTTRSQMLWFEGISITMNLLMLTVVAIRSGWWKVNVRPLFITIVLWVMCALFLLNTLGNLLSTNTFEKLVLTPLTLLLALCCFRSAVTKQYTGTNLLA